MKTKPILIIISLILITILVAACNDVDESQKADSNYTTQDTKVFSNGPKNPSIIINNGDVSTDSRTVNLSLSANDNQAVIACLISESSTKPLANANNWIPVGSSASYSGDSSFVLSSAEAGLKTVYVWFKDGEGNISATTNDSIDYPSAITVNPTSITTSETGSTAAFSVGLNTEPGGEVMIDVVSSDTTEGIVDSSLLTFTTTNWNNSQTITVTGQDDNIDDGNQNVTIQLSINGSTADTTGYTALNPDDVSVVNSDNDSIGFTVNPINVITGEDGTADTFSVVLNTQPDGDVVIDVVSSDTTECIVDSSLLTFTTGNWNNSQTITVTGQDDNLDDSNQNVTIQLSINGNTADTTGYAALNPDDVSVVNSDNDSIGFTVNPNSIGTNETGLTATFSVVLNTQPDGDVVIDVLSSDTTEGIVDSSLLTFTTANWDSNQTITVTGQDDNVIDSSQSFAIQLTLNSGSTADTTGYALLDPDDVSIINYDDDWELPDTGQTTSFTPTFGEDHDYLINPPSFTDNSDGTVTDNNTGLVWQQDDDNNTYTWSAAAIICENVSLG
ncbi:MAG: hypothetical protein HOD92_25755, partial [Deltaproteobacteria bacterium]|nr:hypothetical protein [Deltaproteobacteria bacterium]